MQEEVTQKTIALSMKTGKLTAQALQAALKKYLQHRAKGPKLHHGKQSLKQLKAHGAALTNIEVTEANIGAFKPCAKKYGVDFTLPGPSGAAWATPCYSVSVCSRPAASASRCLVPTKAEKGKTYGVCDRSQRFDPCKIQSLIRADQAAAGLLRRRAPHGRAALFFDPGLSFQQRGGPADDFCHVAGAAVRSV